MIAREPRLLLAVGAALIVAGAVATAASPPRSVPAELRGMPSQVRETASEIQRIVTEQRGMIEKAHRAKTSEQREEVFRAITRNVQDIAEKRVVIMEHYAKRARERVQWARKHASETQVSDLVRAMEEFAEQGPPRSPFAEQTGDARHGDDSPRRPRLPQAVLDARNNLERTLTRLRSLGDECKQARTDEQRQKIKQEITACLKIIEKERVTVLEAVLEISEKRLRWARQRAKEAGS